MIAFDTVMNALLTIVNLRITQGGYDKPVKIFRNLGIAELDYMSSGGEIVSKVRGVYRNQASQISAVSEGLNMLTGTAVIDFMVDAVPDANGEFPEANRFASALDYAAGRVTGQYMSANDNGITYAVLPVMSPATVGTYQEDSSNWGAYVPVSVQIAFTALEGAVSPSSMHIYIDGVKIPASELVLSRTKSSTTDVAANSLNGETTTADESSTFEVQLACPYTNASRAMMRVLYGDERSNTGHCVILRDTEYGFDKCYLMSLVKVVATRQSSAIVGLNVNLLELSPNTARLPVSEGWETKTVTVSALDVVRETLSGGAYVIYWGDGTSQLVDASDGAVTVSHIYNVDGVCKIVIYELTNWEG